MPIFNKTKIAELTPTVTAGAYSASDVVGGLLTFDLTGGAENGGVIRRIVIADDGDVKAAGSLYLFSAEPTTIADNAAFAPVIADLKKLIHVQAIVSGDYATINGNAYAIIDDLSIEYATTTGKIYGYFVPSGTPTYGSTSDLTFRLVAWLD